MKTDKQLHVYIYKIKYDRSHICLVNYAVIINFHLRVSDVLFQFHFIFDRNSF